VRWSYPPPLWLEIEKRQSGKKGEKHAVGYLDGGQPVPYKILMFFKSQ
jgi:hypothetical protein